MYVSLCNFHHSVNMLFNTINNLFCFVGDLKAEKMMQRLENSYASTYFSELDTIYEEEGESLIFGILVPYTCFYRVTL